MKLIERIKLIGLFLACSVLFGLSVYVSRVQEAQAQITTPSLGDGKYLDPNSAPCLPFNIGPATGTTAVSVRTGGPGWINWVALSTAPGNYLTMFDTGTATGLVAGQQQFTVGVGTRVVSEIGGLLVYATTSTAANAAFDYATRVYSFTPPALFQTGLAARSTCSTCWATVCTRLYGTQFP